MKLYGIATMRKARGINQSQLAERVGCLQKDVSRWENGGHEPNAASLRKIAEALSCSIDDLYGNAPDEAAREHCGELKRLRAAECSGLRQCPAACDAVFSALPACWWDKYTAEHIGEVAAMLKAAYDKGRAAGEPASISASNKQA